MKLAWFALFAPLAWCLKEHGCPMSPGGGDDTGGDDGSKIVMSHGTAPISTKKRPTVKVIRIEDVAPTYGDGYGGGMGDDGRKQGRTKYVKGGANAVAEEEAPAESEEDLEEESEEQWGPGRWGRWGGWGWGGFPRFGFGGFGAFSRCFYDAFGILRCW